MNSKIVILVSALTIGVGAIVFGYYTTESMKLDRSQFQEKVLKVVSYPAFISAYGPGVELGKLFEKRTGAKVELVNAGDPAIIVNRLLADPKSQADVIVGIDQILAKRAQELGWKALKPELLEKVKPELRVISGNSFVPISWSPLTMIYKSNGEVGAPKKLKSLQDFYGTEKEKRLALEDPRGSVLGNQWVYWYDQAGLSESMASQIPTRVAISWSQAYGQFKKKNVDMVFSYLTSVVFHWDREQDRSYSFYEFEEGHPFQIDAAGVLERCSQCELAHQFVEFLLEPGSQALIMQKNYMLPSVKEIAPSGMFAELPDLKLISYEQLENFEKKKEQLQKSYLKSVK